MRSSKLIYVFLATIVLSISSLQSCSKQVARTIKISQTSAPFKELDGKLNDDSNQDIAGPQPTTVIRPTNTSLLPEKTVSQISTPNPKMKNAFSGTIFYKQYTYNLVSSYDKAYYFPVSENGTSRMYGRPNEPLLLRFHFEADQVQEMYLAYHPICRIVEKEVEQNTFGIVCEDEGSHTLRFGVEHQDKETVYLIKIDLIVADTLPQKGPSALPGGLILEEHELENQPSIEPFNFKPVSGATEEILWKRSSEREKKVQPFEVARDYQTRSLTDGRTLTARTIMANPPERQNGAIVKVALDGKREFTTWVEAPNSSYGSLAGLWQHNNDWYLEVVSEEGGEIFRSGQSLNDLRGFDESFGFQLLDGKPFFFFVRLGQLGIFYAGAEASLGYTLVPHYHCCSPAVLNPNPYENMVAFFALRNDTWYYIELGTFFE